MSFKGIEDRFNAFYKQLYDSFSTKDKGDGSKQDQPFLEFKPDDNNRTVGENDSRTLPIGATERDVLRVGDFSKSNSGILFAVEQELLQTGNTFGETRLINPLFVIGNAVPFIHLDRPLTNATDIPLNGDQTQKSPASDDSVKSAGRLQEASAQDAIARVTGDPTSGLLSTLDNPASLLSLLGSMIGIGTGILGVNQRPEFNVNGQLYSVLVWEGFKKNASTAANLYNLANLAQNAIQGNIPAVINNISNVASTVLNQALNTPTITDGRNSPNPWEDGKRYFITSDTTADTYLKDAVSFTVNPDNTTIPKANVGFLNRTPYIIVNSSTTASPIQTFQSSFGVSSFLDNSQNSITSFVNNVTSQLRSAISPPSSPSLLSQIPTSLTSLPSGSIGGDDNPAESDMLFPELSARQRYNTDNRTSFIRQQLDAKAAAFQNYWSQNKTIDGFVGGIEPQNPPIINPRARNGITSYIHDRLNDYPIKTGTGNLQTSDATIQDIYKNYGQDLVNVMFFDYGNKRTIPFRAFLDNIEENVQTEENDTRYIGRIERNVVYTGVIRELTFNLYTHAFSDVELDRVWRKLNYLTGLCYPADYDNGYMVPPLVKLTMGDFYRDQPGYFKSINNIIEPDTPWEITPGIQVPHGILSHISFVVIEKFQAKADSIFYPYGIPRNSDVQVSSNFNTTGNTSTIANTPNISPSTILGGGL